MTKLIAANECPKCHGMLEDDGSCSCGYGVKRRSATRAAVACATFAGQLCAWNDRGRPCPCKGIISSATDGSGSWYCREHWERLQGGTPASLGNALPALRVPRSSYDMRKWDGWYEDYIKRRDRRTLPAEPIPPSQRDRQPGDDDEDVFGELVPEQAGQA